MLPLADALARVLAAASPLPPETLPLSACDRRVLAEDVHSPIAVPAADNSAMDGYAVRAADAVEGAVLPVSQRIAAGSVGQPLRPGTAARIFTGAPVPPGADAVVMQEQTEALDGAVRFTAAAQPGYAIRRAGEDVARGATVLRQGERLTPAALGLAAGIGRATLAVARAPRAVLLATGDELVRPGAVAPEALPPGALYNSNHFLLDALLRRAGCTTTDGGQVPDTLEATTAALRAAAESHDLVVTTGGVSVGEEDHVKAAVESLGTLQLWSLAIKPGKPFAFGSLRRADGSHAHFVGLPGNPVSAFVTWLLLVRPFVLALQGAAEPVPPAGSAPAHFDWLRPDPRRQEFLRVRRNAAGGLDLFANQGSGVLTSAAWADGLVDLAPGQTVRHGDTVAVRWLGDWL